ncbi:hypothetical protein BSF41_46930 [Flavobacterium sp. ACN2]|uniref:hypothetical protein n=1 Tax=Flavobacterium sp. ACN2 TaxID=1975676 RepID=UPI0011441B27|nr:hypothetical protein [Flavobacterium sp. ACN2]PBI82879.1 hypothetical protein BSF41_46930 [Flavobacterium sp. ACN2]
MRIHLLLFFILFSLTSQSQTIQTIDSLNNEICQSLAENKILNDEIRLHSINKSHVMPFLAKFKDTIAQRKAFEKMIYRLQKNCNEFNALFPKDSIQNDWGMQNEKPIGHVSKEQCNTFDESKKFHYWEERGKKVEVTINGNLWIEKFGDNTFSKLLYRKRSNCEFELEFIESNNLSRKNLSVKGDKYRYKIYDEEENIYSVYSKNKETYYTFKLIKE